MTINRRQFLTGVLGGSAAAGLVHFSGMSSLLSMAEASASTVPKNGPFVLVTLTGGNDGLNTVIPYSSGTYYDWRGELAIPADQVRLRFDAAYGVNRPGRAEFFWPEEGRGPPKLRRLEPVRAPCSRAPNTGVVGG